MAEQWKKLADQITARRCIAAIVNERLAEVEVIGKSIVLTYETSTVKATLKPSLRCNPKLYIDPEDIEKNSVSLSDTLKMLGELNGSDTLLNEIRNSANNQIWHYANRFPTPTLNSSMLEWEHSIVEGHATHPCNRSRFSTLSDLETPQLEDLASLFNPRISFVTLPISLVQLHGNYREIVGRLAVTDQSRVVIPVHELQIPNIRSMFPSSEMLPDTHCSQAQASLRTVSLPALADFDFKLSLGFHTTSALRTISKYSVHNGPRVSKLAAHVNSSPMLHVVKEVASVGALHDDPDIAKHLACIVRENPISISNEYGLIMSAALVEKDKNGTPYLLTAFGLDTLDKRVTFLQHYIDAFLDCFIPPLLNFGFAFEAHGQNVLAKFDSISHKLIGFCIRDFGGIRMHKTTMESKGLNLRDILPESCIVTDDLKEVYDKAYHCMIFCHLHRLIRALDLHYCGNGWNLLSKGLQQRIPEGTQLHQMWFADRVKYKCFLRMKLQGLYRNYVYTDVANLLRN